VLAIDFRRGRVHWSVRSITLQTASVWSVIYIPFIHPIHNAKIGVWECVVIQACTQSSCERGKMWLIYRALAECTNEHTIGLGRPQRSVDKVVVRPSTVAK